MHINLVVRASAECSILLIATSKVKQMMNGEDMIYQELIQIINGKSKREFAK